ncbi:MAG: hypothetical protein ACFB0C_13000 [Leptolyngbyaceae cyanobacterium]
MNNFSLWSPSPAWATTLSAAPTVGPNLPNDPVATAIPVICIAMVIVVVIGALRRELGAATWVGLCLGGVLMALGMATP